MKIDSDPFGFNRLKYIRNVDESKALNNSNEPCIIISASGMMEGGRVVHHLRNTISDKKNTILIVGYCAPFTLGNRIMQGAETIRIYGEDIPVKADVKILTEYSAHGDYQEMIDFLSCQDPSKVKEMYLVHGNYEVQQEYREKLLEKGFKNIRIPDEGSEYLI